MHDELQDEKNTQLLVERAKNGDRTGREELIVNNQAFIAKCVSQAVYSQADVKATDEYSIALLAFNEAIDSYDMTRGASFHGFARQVIKRRLVDHYRTSRRHENEVLYAEPPDVVAEPESPFPADEMKEEIERLAVRLDTFGISFKDLVDNTPKHRDSRQIAIGIARRILEDSAMRASLERKKKLPFTALLKQLFFNPKTIQRHRKYIIAVYLILGDELPLLQAYVQGAEKGGAQSGR